MQDFKRNRHAVYRLYYHLVVVTKYRHACITPEIMARLKEIAHDLFNKWGAEVIEMNGESDHVHILFEAPPQVQLSKLVNNCEPHHPNCRYGWSIHWLTYGFPKHYAPNRRMAW